MLTVSDTGVGIAPDLLPQLFQPFRQADHSLDRSRGGLGLGLFVVKGLTELHGGEVSAASDGPERERRFTVRLPLQPEPAALSVPSAALSPASRRRRVPSSWRTIAMRPTACECCWNCSATKSRVAYNGPDGVRERQSWVPEIVLCGHRSAGAGWLRCGTRFAASPHHGPSSSVSINRLRQR